MLSWCKRIVVVCDKELQLKLYQKRWKPRIQLLKVERNPNPIKGGKKESGPAC